MSKDIIKVREDESFDEQQLASLLNGNLEGAEMHKLKVMQFSGGAANLTYELNYPSKTYVLRRPPLGAVAKSAHSMAREYKVLSVLYKSFPYAPQAYYFCDDTDIIGAEFFIMERKYGTVIRKTIPNQYRQHSKLGIDISKSLIDTLAEFHRVDYQVLGLGDLGRPDGFVERQIHGWYKRWQKAKVKDSGKMDAVYDWLVKNQPEDYPFSLVHNDWKLDNVMLDDRDPSKLIGVFDWDMSTLGTPLSDLGTMLTYWTETSDPEYFKQTAMMPIEDVGFFTRDQLVKRYAQKSGLSIDNINFYHVLGLFRLTVIIAQIYIRYVRKQTLDNRFAAFGKMTTLVIQKAYEIAIEP